MKRLIACLLMVWVFATATVSATSLSIYTESNEVKVNDNIVLSFTIDEISQLKGLQFDIFYDPESLVLKGTEKGSIFDEAFVGGISTNQNGTIKVVVAFGSAVDFSGEICTAEFEVLDGNQNVSVRISDCKVSSEEAVVLEETECLLTVTDATVVDRTDDTDESGSGEDVEDVIDPQEPDSSEPETGSSNFPALNDSGSKEEKDESIQSSEADEKKDETLFVDSDVSVLNKENVPKRTFADITGHWAEQSILAMAESGVVKGVSDTEFQPDRNVTRAEFATMISKALKLSEAAENVYSDVAEDAWYKDVILQCTKAGLVQGSDGRFRPNALISREEMAVILYRTKNYISSVSEEDATDITTFADDSEIAGWAKQAVACMAKSGIINGMGNNLFAPKLSATRAQAVIVLEQILKLL